MTIDIEYFPLIGDSPVIHNFMRTLLLSVSNEFVPPLTDRSVSYEKNFLEREDPVEGFEMYMMQKMSESCLVASIDGTKAGLMTFKRHFGADWITEWCPCNYIVTVGVFPKFRRHGLTKLMYDQIGQIDVAVQPEFDVVRTWSTNDAHIALLVSIGFAEVQRLKDHRGDGIDTVYFSRVNTTELVRTPPGT
ncbi:MAG TPA: hypothetical protein PKB15_06070 [Acidimicrobiia bacterium]|nr:hypothetical protein [Acidimicrobiia bacterium]